MEHHSWWTHSKLTATWWIFAAGGVMDEDEQVCAISFETWKVSLHEINDDLHEAWNCSLVWDDDMNWCLVDSRWDDPMKLSIFFKLGTPNCVTEHAANGEEIQGRDITSCVFQHSSMRRLQLHCWPPTTHEEAQKGILRTHRFEAFDNMFSKGAKKQWSFYNESIMFKF